MAGAEPSPVLLSEPRLHLWRAPVDNDGFKLMPELARRIGVGGDALERWIEAGLDRRPADELVEHRVDRMLDDDGLTCRHVVVVPDALADLPRIGVMFEVIDGFEMLAWWGRGPHENYPDRNRSAPLGEWQAPPDELPYLVPQEYGLRTEGRWFELTDRRRTLRIDVIEPTALHISATHHRPRDLFAAPTVGELRRSPGLVVCLDVAHRGLGTASCGPDVLPRYRIAPGRYEFAYRLSLR